MSEASVSTEASPLGFICHFQLRLGTRWDGVRSVGLAGCASSTGWQSCCPNRVRLRP
jgi:hypothetical protein